VYRPRVTSDQYTPQMVDYLATLSKKSPFTRVAVVYDQTHAGVIEQLPALKKDLAAKGFDVVASEAFSVGAASFDSQIAAISRSNAQAVLFQGYAPDAATYIKQSRADGFNGPFVSNVGFAAGDLTKAAVPAAAMQNVYDLGSPFPSDLISLKIDTAGATAFQSAYKAKYGEGPGFTSASAYDGVYILAKAIEKAGSVTDYTGIRAALDQLKVSDVTNLAEEITPQAGGDLFKDHQAYFKSVVHVWNGSAFVPTQLVG
jgi:branched-chain amino acid transport system substrate-binding protein